ncbi:MAG: DUF1295 domain-containing protein [Pontixanthobacter sp.]
MGEALLVNAAVLVVAMLLCWLISLKIDDVSFIDAVWGAGMALMAVTAWFQLGYPGVLADMIMLMAAIWGVRLGLHLFLRWRKEGEDQRYKRILKKDREAGHFARAALVKIFGMQAVLLFMTCLPAQLGILASNDPAPVGALAFAGLALWTVGMVFETLGDWQLKQFKANPANEGKILDSGLWRYTRHPNYFGDACVWWGIWLAAASAGWDIAFYSVVGPIFLTFTLTKWSGAALLEKGMTKKRGDKYTDYIARTSAFIPWPPKHG